MCFGVPSKMVETHEKGGLHMAEGDFGGIARDVLLNYMPETQVGQHCLIHMGFVISIPNEDLAFEKLDLLKEIVV